MNKRDSMKIAMFGHKRIPSREGGVEIVVEELASRMVELGHNVVCYNRAGHHVSGSEYDRMPISEYKGIKIKTVWTIEKKGLAAVTGSISAAICSALSDADVVHIHAEGPAAMCFIPKLFGKKVIVTIHGLDWKRAKWSGFATKYIKWGEKQAAKHADHIIVLSKNAQRYFKDTYGRDTILIPNGVNKPELVKAKEITERWGLTKDSYILFLGRIVPEKGVQYLLDAWKDIKTNKQLVVCGGSSDTQEFIEKLKSNATYNVIFTGFQQGRILEELYSNAYIYCLPSDLEGMPLSLLEAMSFGNCCLVSDIPECTEAVDDKAILFRKSDVQNLKQVLQDLLDNPENVMRFKISAAEYITKKYNWDVVVERTLELYRREK